MEGCKVDQAYFSALMTFIGFIEFMSGLFAGNLEGPTDTGISAGPAWIKSDVHTVQ
jgi:hypothetical protein